MRPDVGTRETAFDYRFFVGVGRAYGTSPRAYSAPVTISNELKNKY